MATGSTTQVRTIRVIADVRGDADLKKIAASMGQVSKSVKQTADSITSLRDLTAGFAGATIFGFGIREVIGIADSMTTLRSRIVALTGDVEGTANTLKRLNDVATITKSNIDGIKEVYGRVATSTQRLNLGTEATIALTQILAQSFRLAGTTAAEAQAATIQFTQALSFGQLRGQELRSVLSQNATLATIFGKAIEGSGKSVFQFAEQGGFTTKFVLEVLSKNFKEINDKANTMAQTFEQTLSLAMNKFKIAIDDVNTKFNINGAFAKTVDYLIEKLPVLIDLVTVLAIVALPKLIKTIAGLGAGVLLVNPITAFIGVVTFALSQVAGGIRELIAEIVGLPVALAEIGLQIVGIVTTLAGLTGPEGLSKPLDTFLKDQIKYLQELNRFTVEEIKKSLGVKETKEFVGPLPQEDLGTVLGNAAGKIKDPIATIEKQIGALNTLFNKGQISAVDYVEKLGVLEKIQLTEKLNDGTISLKKFKDEMDKNSLEGFAILLDAGALSIDQFNEKIRLFKIDQLKDKFNQGKITTAEFTSELVKLQKTGFGDFETYLTGFQAGVGSYLESLGSMSSQIATIVESSFGRFEDAIFQATKGATDSFANMAQSILDDLTKIAIRMAIVNPIANSFSGLFTPAAASAGPSAARAFAPTAIPFADGGVVENPTFFGMAGRKMGVAGEAGPEAIIPLKRGAGGQLGVGAAPVSVNIVNNSGAEISTSEKRNSDGSVSINMVVHQIVKEGISNGTFDRSMQQSFGVQRRGI